MSYWYKICLRILICLLNVYIYIYTKFAAVACLVEGQFLPAMENRVMFLILWHGNLTLILSIKEGQNFDPMRA